MIILIPHLQKLLAKVLFTNQYNDKTFVYDFLRPMNEYLLGVYLQDEKIVNKIFIVCNCR